VQKRFGLLGEDRKSTFAAQLKSGEWRVASGEWRMTSDESFDVGLLVDGLSDAWRMKGGMSDWL
jgi:hypothetical protein